jgi:hypothetical protein
VCSCDKVEHREEESRSYQGSPECEHDGQLTASMLSARLIANDSKQYPNLLLQND